MRNNHRVWGPSAMGLDNSSGGSKKGPKVMEATFLCIAVVHFHLMSICWISFLECCFYIMHAMMCISDLKIILHLSVIEAGLTKAQ